MSDERITRERAMAAGRAAERLLAFELGRLEDLSLWALEQAAGMQPDSERLRVAEQRLNQLRSLTTPLPRILGRLAAGSAYFGLRLSAEAARGAKEIRDDTSAFLSSDPQPKED
jgi:hypothetical protein